MKKVTQKIKQYTNSQSGFTLIELLIVIVIISALAVTVFVALNPVQRLKDSRDARRTSDVETLLTAIHQYIVDNKGALPPGMTTSMLEKQLGTGVAADCSPVSTGGCSVATTTACVDLTAPLSKYLKSIPVDPLGGTTWTAVKTGYTVTVDANNIITVKACGGESATNVSQSR